MNPLKLRQALTLTGVLFLASACATGELEPLTDVDLGDRRDMTVTPPKDMKPPVDQGSPEKDMASPEDMTQDQGDQAPDMADMADVDMRVPGPCGGITCGATEVCRLNQCVDLCDGISCGEVTDSVTQKKVMCGMCEGSLACIAGECVDACTQANAQCGELLWSGVQADCGVCQSGQQVCSNNVCTQLGYRAIAAGMFHSCAIFSSGEIKCWGDNSCGQLGNDNIGTNDSVCATPGPPNAQARVLLPTTLSALSNVTHVDAFFKHTCAATADGNVYCWGWNNYGQLGDGATRNRTLPYRQPSLSMVAQAGAGNSHSCAMGQDKKLRCWGYNGQGQLGDNTISTSYSPKQVRALDDVSVLSVGANHACAIQRDGQLYCWGFNGTQEAYGRLGTGFTASSSSPLKVVQLDRVRAVSAGDAHTCAVRQNGELWCWGDNAYGQLGLGTTTDSLLPVLNRSLTNVVDVTAGQGHTCAITADRRLHCWGRNEYGQVGDGTTTNRLTPALLNGVTGALTATAGYYHSCAVTTDNRAFCWGRNDYGQLGDGTTTQRLSPTLVR